MSSRSLRAMLRPVRCIARALRSTRRTLEAVPGLVDAIMVLPAVSRQIEVVAFQTATLTDMHEALLRVQGNTGVLPRMDERLAGMHDALGRVDVNTQAVERLAEVALPLHGAALRLGRFADRLPPSRAARLSRP